MASTSFIRKLREMEADAEGKDYIYLSSDQSILRVRNNRSFAQHILPKFFRHKNFSSFNRVLYMNGFVKAKTASAGKSSYDKEIWEFKRRKPKTDSEEKIATSSFQRSPALVQVYPELVDVQVTKEIIITIPACDSSDAGSNDTSPSSILSPEAFLDDCSATPI